MQVQVWECFGKTQRIVKVPGFFFFAILWAPGSKRSAHLKISCRRVNVAATIFNRTIGLGIGKQP